MFIPPKQSGEKEPEAFMAGTSEFPDTAGDKLETSDIMMDAAADSLMVMSHYQNGKILCYKAPLNDMDNGDINEVTPEEFLEHSEKLQFILSSRSLKRCMSLQEAIQVAKNLRSDDLI